MHIEYYVLRSLVFHANKLRKFYQKNKLNRPGLLHIFTTPILYIHVGKGVRLALYTSRADGVKNYKKSWQAMGFLEQGDAELTADENNHWREVAQYERYTKPLLVRLRSVEWPALLTLHSARWHRGAVETIRARTPKYHYCSSALSHQELIKESKKSKPSDYGWLSSYYNAHTGKYRQIQRYPLDYVWDTGTYPVRFCPPTGPPVGWGSWFRTSDFTPDWTPEAQARRSYEARKELIANWLTDRETFQRNGPNRRQFLADSLRDISQQLGKYVRKDYWNADGMFYEMNYELEFDLNKALAINNKPGTHYSFEPTALGEVVAKWEQFQRRLLEFHEAEKPAPAATIAISAPEIPKPPEPTTDSQLVRDTYLHFPGVFEPFAGLDEREGIRQWAMHLADLWASPRQHSAPSNYDAAYYNQSGATRAEFLAALRRIQAAVWLALRAPGAQRELFEGRGLIPDGESKELRGEALTTLATRGAAWLLAWLTWREQRPTQQLFTALGTIELANTNLGLTSREAERPPCLFVPDSSPAVEASRFTKLLAEFRQHLPSKRAKLRALLAELEPLRTLPAGLLTTGPASELAGFPILSWAGRKEYPTDCTLTETFWPDLEQALRTRAEWAARAYDVATGALGEASKPEINSLVPLAPTLPSPTAGAFAPLLLNYALADLTALIAELGLLTMDTGQATPAATSGAWVGVIHGLLEARRPRLKGSKAAIWRAFSSTFGAVGSERAVQNGLGTRGSTAEQFRDRTLALLKE